MNDTTLFYEGTVNIKLKIGDKIIEKQAHNAGTNALMKAICKFLSGYGDNNDIAKYADLRRAAKIGEIVPEDVKWSSFLTSQISVESGRYYEYNTSLENWISRYSFSIPYAVLLDDILEDDDTRYGFRLYLYTEDTETGKNVDLAYINVSSEDLSKITPGIQAIVEWSLQIKNS